MKNYGALHDGSFEGLWLEGKSAHIFLATDEHERHVIVAREVAALKADDVRQGNIIFEVVEHSAAEVSPSDLDVFLYESDAPTQSKTLWEKVQAEGLALLEISPSYGATCIVLARSFDLLGRREWVEHYISGAISHGR